MVTDWFDGHNRTRQKADFSRFFMPAYWGQLEQLVVIGQCTENQRFFDGKTPARKYSGKSALSALAMIWWPNSKASKVGPSYTLMAQYMKAGRELFGRMGEPESGRNRTDVDERTPHKSTPLRAAPCFRPDPVRGSPSRSPLINI